MKINPLIFRGYDLRGVTDKDLNPEIVEHLGKAYGTFLNRMRIKQAVIGRDIRLSSEDYSKAMIKGLNSTGVNTIDIGLSLVQIVYFAQYHFKMKGCVYVTASHNPPEYNGFKFGTGFSDTMITEEILELRDIADKGEFVSGNGTNQVFDSEEIKEIYFKDILNRVEIKNKFKVVVDPSNSTPGKFMPELLERVGCEVIQQNCELDGNFPSGTPDPTAEEVSKRLAKRVLKEKADLGFSYDSDGDRMGVVDGKGNMIWNDVLVALFATDILRRAPGAKIVYNALCSKLTDEIIRKYKGEPVMWMTGHSFIKERTKRERALFGGELSGHFFFCDNFYGHDDACFATLRLLEYLSNENKSLAEVYEALPRYISSPEVKVGCPDDKKVELIDKVIVKEFEKKFGKENIISIDGARADFADGMMIIRYSHNGPYITIKYEAKDIKTYNQRRQWLYDLLKSHPEVDWSFGVNVPALAEEQTQ